MRLLNVVDCYGPDGGSRGAPWCRELATGLADRGHSVDVLTGGDSGAAPAGNGRRPAAGGEVHPPAVPPGRGTHVAVRHLTPDLPGRTGGLRPLLDTVGGPVPLEQQEAWMAPRPAALAGLQSWLAESAAGYDVIAFFDYAAPITWAGLAACAGRVATVLHPMAAASAWLSLSLFDTSLRLPSAYAFVDAAEEDVMTRRLGRRPAGAVIGPGGSDMAVSRYERLLWVVQSHR